MIIINHAFQIRVAHQHNRIENMFYSGGIHLNFLLLTGQHQLELNAYRDYSTTLQPCDVNNSASDRPAHTMPVIYYHNEALTDGLPMFPPFI